MPEPIYVPAPAGLEAILLRLTVDEFRPTDEDVCETSCPVVAWRIEDNAQFGGTIAIPVLACAPSVSQDCWVLIPMAQGRFCVFRSLTSGGGIYDSLDDVKEWLVHDARRDWDKSHPPGIPDRA